MRSRFLRRTKLLRASLLLTLGTIACGGRTEFIDLEGDDWSSSGGAPVPTGGRSSDGGAPSSGGSGPGPSGGQDSGGTSAGGSSSGGTAGSGGAASGGAQNSCAPDGVEMQLVNSGGIDVAFALTRTKAELLVAGYYWSGSPDTQTYHSAIARLAPDDRLLDDIRANFAEYDAPRGIALHPSGSVFLAGVATETTQDPPYRSLVVRFSAQGLAWRADERSQKNEQATAIAAGPAGTTYVVGYSYGALGTDDQPRAFLRRYLDVDSGTSTVAYDVSDFARLDAITIGERGRLYLAGSSLIAGQYRAHVRVIERSGTLVRDMLFEEGTEQANALLLKDDGTIVVAGSGAHGAFAKWITPEGLELFTSWVAAFGETTTTGALALDARGAVWWVGGSPEVNSSFLTNLMEDGDRPWTSLFDGSAHAMVGDDSCNLYLAGDFGLGEGRGPLLKVRGGAE